MMPIEDARSACRQSAHRLLRRIDKCRDLASLEAVAATLAAAFGELAAALCPHCFERVAPEDSHELIDGSVVHSACVAEWLMHQETP